MAGFLLRVLIVAVGLWIAAELVPGVDVSSEWTLLAAALLLGIVNAVVRPVVVILTLPISILTLGLFLLVINAGMIGLVALLLEGLRIDGFWSALLASLIVSLVSWIAARFVGPKGRFEVMVATRRSEPY